ncbi:hypothetical protein HDE_05886 [Halotydeus destructor]|nr:hypothetical protein HDE_05886 [Halotydeus destructor]
MPAAFILGGDRTMVVEAHKNIVLGVRHQTSNRVKYNDELVAVCEIWESIEHFYNFKHDTGDLTLTGEDPGEEICHSQIVTIRCYYFLARSENNWKDGADMNIKLPFSFKVVNDVILSVYTEEVTGIENK